MLWNIQTWLLASACEWKRRAFLWWSLGGPQCEAPGGRTAAWVFLSLGPPEVFNSELSILRLQQFVQKDEIFELDFACLGAGFRGGFCSGKL